MTDGTLNLALTRKMAQSDIYTDHSRLPDVPFTFKALQTITGVGIGCGVGVGIGRAMELSKLSILPGFPPSATNGGAERYSGK